MKSLILLGVSMLWPLASHAADFKPLNVKPGLWEATMNSQTNGAFPVPADMLARLTPEQRARAEAAMKAAPRSHSSTNKSCITAEQLNKPLTFADEKNVSCKRTLVSSSGSQQEIRMECSGGDVKTVATMHIEAVNPETVKGTSEVTSTGSQNKMNAHLSFNAKWLGSDCGSYKKK